LPEQPFPAAKAPVMLALRLVIWVLGTLAFYAGLLFIPAGRWDWEAGWHCLAVTAVTMVVGTFWFYRANPELVERRLHPKTKESAPWDPWLVAGLILAYLLQMVIAALDQGRLNGGPPPAVWWSGLTLYLAGFAFMGWAVGVNPFFETTVRHQTDREHRVIDSGPYALVRHPGYAGGLVYFLSHSLLLGSLYSSAAWIVCGCILAARIVLEEEYLRAKLEGYEEYSGRVRYRLLPGLW